METHIFKGKYQISGMSDSIQVEAIDRESAIAYLETTYPTFKWYSSELKIQEEK